MSSALDRPMSTISSPSVRSSSRPGRCPTSGGSSPTTSLPQARVPAPYSSALPNDGRPPRAASRGALSQPRPRRAPRPRHAPSTDVVPRPAGRGPRRRLPTTRARSGPRVARPDRRLLQLARGLGGGRLRRVPGTSAATSRAIRAEPAPARDGSWIRRHRTDSAVEPEPWMRTSASSARRRRRRAGAGARPARHRGRRARVRSPARFRAPRGNTSGDTCGTRTRGGRLSWSWIVTPWGARIPTGSRGSAARGVGGSTLHWEGYAAAPPRQRLSARARSTGSPRTGRSHTPELEPYYGLAERALGVAGQRRRAVGVAAELAAFRSPRSRSATPTGCSHRACRGARRRAPSPAAGPELGGLRRPRAVPRLLDLRRLPHRAPRPAST